MYIYADYEKIYDVFGISIFSTKIIVDFIDLNV